MVSLLCPFLVFRLVVVAVLLWCAFALLARVALAVAGWLRGRGRWWSPRWVWLARFVWLFRSRVWWPLSLWWRFRRPGCCRVRR